jgi:hypothetical protein
MYMCLYTCINMRMIINLNIYTYQYMYMYRELLGNMRQFKSEPDFSEMKIMHENEMHEKDLLRGDCGKKKKKYNVSTVLYVYACMYVRTYVYVCVYI